MPRPTIVLLSTIVYHFIVTNVICNPSLSDIGLQYGDPRVDLSGISMDIRVGLVYFNVTARKIGGRRV